MRDERDILEEYSYPQSFIEFREEYSLILSPSPTYLYLFSHIKVNTIIPGVISGASVISGSTHTVPVVVPWETEPSERRREICFKGPVSNTILNQNRQRFLLVLQRRFEHEGVAKAFQRRRLESRLVQLNCILY